MPQNSSTIGSQDFVGKLFFQPLFNWYIKSVYFMLELTWCLFGRAINITIMYSYYFDTYDYIIFAFIVNIVIQNFHKCDFVAHSYFFKKFCYNLCKKYFKYWFPQYTYSNNWICIVMTVPTPFAITKFFWQKCHLREQSIQWKYQSLRHIILELWYAFGHGVLQHGCYSGKGNQNMLGTHQGSLVLLYDKWIFLPGK